MANKGNGATQQGQPVSPTLPSQPGIFDNLDALRLSPADGATVGTRELLSRVPVRKPLRTEFFRIHRDEDMQLTTGVFIDREERETYFVVPDLRGEMAGEWRPVMLVTAISRQGVTFLWPIGLPDETGRVNAWAVSAQEACEHAKTHWVRLVPDMSLGAYRIYFAEGDLGEPQWLDKPLAELLAIGFKGRIVDDLDHPVIRRLRGL